MVAAAEVSLFSCALALMRLFSVNRHEYRYETRLGFLSAVKRCGFSHLFIQLCRSRAASGSFSRCFRPPHIYGYLQKQCLGFPDKC